MPLSVEKKRIIFIGPVGSGKSATINTLLGEDKAPSENNLQSTSLTKVTKEYISEYGILVDTPGIMEGHLQSVLKYVKQNPPDAIAFVFAASRLRSNQKEAIQEINTTLEAYFDKAFILLTKGGYLQKDEHDFIDEKKSKEIYSLYLSVGKRCVVFENCTSLSEKRKYICAFKDSLHECFNNESTTKPFMVRAKESLKEIFCSSSK